MEIKDFIGKYVINSVTKERYVLTAIDGVAISARKQSDGGCFRWMTGTTPKCNALSNGTLAFEDKTLASSFDEVYEKYFYTQGKMDQYLYYMAKYD